MSQFDETIDGSDSSRNPLEVLAAEYSEACRGGVKPSIEEFIARVPEQREEARALLQSLALFERVSEQEATRYASMRRKKQLVEPKFEQLGDYRIVREIGRGGMGVIYEAEQLSLKRRVALKVLAAGVESAKQLERFQREAEAIARLHHTNIVPVYGSGSHGGVHYFAMQLIDGQPLSQPPELSFQEIAKLGMQAASALAYAHSHGVLHRDIKPSNLLLDKGGDLWVTDFGLAKISNVGDLTQTGDIMGTLKYMAPEQLEGRADQRTDIYALGLTLYELATHQPAFDVSKSLANRIRNHDFPAPRVVDKSIPRDLETIILKATACEPQHRYTTASEMADDLRRFIEDRPIEARRASPFERLGRWMRRNPALASSLSATALLMLATTVTTTVGYFTTQHALQETKRARDEANTARIQADEARLQAEVNQVRAENNLNVALKAFDAIFDNVARRGVPQTLTLNVNETAADANAASNAQTEEAPRFEPTLTTADAELLNNLLSFYSQFTQQNNDAEPLRARTASAYQRIGQIQARLGQGEAAIDSFGEALNMVTALRENHADNPEYVRQSAAILNDLGLAYSANGKPIQFIVQSHKFAAEFLRSQPPEMTRRPEIRLEMARAYGLAGSALARGGVSNMDEVQPGGPPEGMAGMFERRIRQFFRGGDPRGDGRPDGPPPPPDGPDNFRDDRGGRPGPGGRPGFGMQGPGMQGPGMPGGMQGPGMNGPGMQGPGMNGPGMNGPGMQGPDRFGPDFGPRDGFRGNDPRGNGPRGSEPNGGDPRGGEPRGPGGMPGGMPGRARAMIDADLYAARDLLAELCQEYPDDTEYQLAYAQSLRHLMMHFLNTQRMSEATEAFTAARQLLTQLMERWPREPKVMVEVADTLSSASTRLKSLDDSEAEELLRQAIGICQRLCEASPGVPEYQALLANSQDRLGLIEARKGQWSAADREHNHAIERLIELVNRFSENRYYQVSALVAAIHLGEMRLKPESQLNDSESLAEARQYLEKTISLYQRNTVMDPFAKPHLKRAADTLTRIYQALGDNDGARKLQEQRRRLDLR